MNSRYEYYKTLIELICIEVGITGSDIRSIAAGANYDDTHVGAKINSLIAGKLLKLNILQP